MKNIQIWLDIILTWEIKKIKRKDQSNLNNNHLEIIIKKDNKRASIFCNWKMGIKIIKWKEKIYCQSINKKLMKFLIKSIFKNQIRKKWNNKKKWDGKKKISYQP